MAENQHSALLCTMHQTVHEWSVGVFSLFQIYIYNEKHSKPAKFKRLRQEPVEMENQREEKHNVGNIISRNLHRRWNVKFTLHPLYTYRKHQLPYNIPIYTPEVTLANVYHPQSEAQPSWVWVKGLALAIIMVLAAVFLHLGWIPYLAAILCKVSLTSKFKVVTFTKFIQ